MQFYVGTSGYSYKEWKGSFYPEKLPQKEMLRYYSERLSTVEVNNSFYRLPAASVIESWTQQVPENFRFVLKAPQAITHFKQLRNCKEPVEQLLEAAAVLKERRGPILFQLPPHLKIDVPRLDAFLQVIDSRAALVFEFRHESWFDDEVFACLKRHGAAHCVADA
ncbi:MAG TPA: DUF72 domain-containing protein, partial [Planctomycetaceae bacterium]|nr:DUF72 domain-containing protein [Planctomycetaceae bacterium]